MKNILVPTDFSDCARAAEDIGLEIAKRTNAEIHFLHLLSTPVDWKKIPVDKEKLYPETRAQIGHAKNELGELMKKAEKQGLNAQQFLVFDKGREEIYNHINYYNHDFVVMGSHGVNGLNEMIGSNAQKVVRNSTAPVLVVKNEAKPFKADHIVFATTFESDVHNEFEKLLDFAHLMDAQVHLLYVNVPYNFKETEEIESYIQDFSAKYPKESFTSNVYNALNETRGIQKFSERINADIIALTTHGRKGFLKMITGSVTENLVNHANIPVLSLNANS